MEAYKDQLPAKFLKPAVCLHTHISSAGFMCPGGDDGEEESALVCLFPGADSQADQQSGVGDMCRAVQPQ